MIGVNLFMAACMWLFLPIVYVSMRNNTVPKNNLILSVTLPPEAQRDREVTDYCEGFKQRLLRNCLLLTALLVPAIFLPRVSVSTTWSLVWLPVAMVWIMRVYAKGFEGLKAIKHRRGWQTAAAGQAVAELRPVKLPQPMKARWFVPPMILSILPVISCLADEWDAAWHSILTMTAGMNLLICAMSLLFYGLIFRQRKDIVNDDVALTAALTRVRRHNWTKMWLVLAWSSALFSLGVWLCQGSHTGFVICTIVYSVVLVAAALITEFATRHAQQRLTRDSARQPAVDEDDLWIWGQFYYNPNSNKIMINERVGMGMSMNIAHPVGKILAVISVLLLLSLPVFGVWLMTEELVPVRTELTEQALIVRRTGTVYTIELDTITGVDLLEDLPAASRIWGTGMPNLLKGRFSVDGIGLCTLCLDPTDPPFLVVDTIHETYILGIDQAEELYEQLN